MAISTQQISERLFKEASGVADTKIPLTDRGLLEEPIPTYTAVLPSEIWKDAASIPSTAPSLTNLQTSGVVKYFEKLSLSIVNAGTTIAYTSNDLKDAISTKFGFSYKYKVYDSTGTIQIFTGDWVVDAEAGVLIFYSPSLITEAVVSSSFPPKITFYKYIGEKGFPTAFTEVDPIFTSSPSSLITLDNLLNINNLSGVNTGDQTLPTLSSLGGVASNTPITAGTDKTKISYDSKGLVISGTTLLASDLPLHLHALNDSNDVQFLVDPPLENGQVLRWNSNTLKWNNHVLTGGGDMLESAYATNTITGNVVDKSAELVSDTLSFTAETLNTTLNTKAPTTSPTFTGTVVLPSTTSIGNVSASEIALLDGLSGSPLQSQLLGKANLSGTQTFTASNTFNTGTNTFNASSIFNLLSFTKTSIISTSPNPYNIVNGNLFEFSGVTQTINLPLANSYIGRLLIIYTTTTGTKSVVGSMDGVTQTINFTNVYDFLVLVSTGSTWLILLSKISGLGGGAGAP